MTTQLPTQQGGEVMPIEIHIGTKWTDRVGRECTVFDIYTTTNRSGCLVNIEYASYYTFLGQRVDQTNNGTTIRRRIFEMRSAS